MDYTLSNRLMDILSSDPTLSVAGAAWPGQRGGAPFSGVRRIDNGEAPQQGAINLFDSPKEKGTLSERPAIFLGTDAIESSDHIDTPCIDGGMYGEYRVTPFYLEVAAMAQGPRAKLDARRQRDQIVANVLRILAGHQVDPNWWDLRVNYRPAGLGGRRSVSAQAGGDGTIAEAFAVLQVDISYFWSPSAQP